MSIRSGPASGAGYLSSLLDLLSPEALIEKPSTGRRRNSRRLLRQFLEALPVAVYTTDPKGRITYHNEAAAELWGGRPEPGTAEWCGSWRLYWPDGTPMGRGQCPMATALKDQRSIRGQEAVLERPDGTRVPFLAYPTLLRGESGRLLGAINVLVDLSDQRRARQFEQRLVSIVESSHDAILGKDLNGVIETWNRGAERLFGYTEEEAVGRPMTFLIPEDRRDEEPAIHGRIRRGERVDHFETLRQRKDGSLVEVSLTASPIESAEGEVIGISSIARDITERRRAQEQQTLLLREMNHRINNLFAITSSLVTLTARSASTPQEMADAINGRLQALARAHELIRSDPTGMAGKPDTTLDALIRMTIAPYTNPAGDGDHKPFVLEEGPEVPIGRNAVTSLALFLHELMTNAAKYGALSTQHGRIRIGWSIAHGKLVMFWEERGGPPVAEAPLQEGFGNLLVRRSITEQLGGKFSHEWAREGLSINLTVPLDSLAQ